MITPRTLDSYLLRQFFPIFLAALALFTMLVILIDLFFYLTRYMSNDADLSVILNISLYYIPKSLSYALPVSLLFATAFTLGDLGTKNELTTVIGSGIPFWRFSLSLIVLGITAAIFAFIFEDHAVIPTLREKNRLNREVLGTAAFNLSSIVIKSEGGRLIYSVDYYEIETMSLYGITIIELEEHRLHAIFHAPMAQWNGNAWSFSEPISYAWDNGFLRPVTVYNTDRFREEPEIFRRGSIAPEDLKIRDLRLLIRDLNRAGLPTASAITDLYQRFSFPAVSFIVIVISLAVSGRFKKNILLLSLLASLGTAVIFYVIRMLTVMSAQSGIITPFWGAWTPVLVCTAAGIIMLKRSKT